MAHTSTSQNKMTEHSLPKGWQRVRLADLLAALETGSRPKGGAQGITSGVPSLSAEHMTRYGTFDFSDLRFVPRKFYEQMPKGHIKPNDILIVKDGATTGKSTFINDSFPYSEAVINEHVFLCRPNLERANPLYLFYFLWSSSGLTQIRTNFQGAAIGGINQSFTENVMVPLPPLDEQRRIAKRLNEQMAAVESARKAAEEQLELSNRLINSYLKQSLSGSLRNLPLKNGFVEVKKGIGKTWTDYPVLGTTRNGVAPAKEKVGKQPERYKLVEPGTIFYNPMRINIGSIGMLDDGDEPGITSPDYVIINSVKGVIHPRWFYYWLRSPYGEAFIKTVARGAVRERMMFTRLAPAYLDVPSYEVQFDIAEKLLGIKRLRVSIESQLSEINRLPASLLREGFAGNL
jgi:type I restriction enzyme S subunit